MPIGRYVDRVLMALAIVLALSITYAAWANVSWGYDIWFYHLPFAARLVGLMDAGSYAFSHMNAARYQGFPLFAELVQGVLWRVTGRVEATNLLALGSLFGLILFLWRLFKVPPHIALFAFLAIPLVHIHATSSYVDITANCFVTMLLLLLYRALLSSEAPSSRSLVGSAALAAATANTKFQLVPIVVVTSLALLVLTLRRAHTKGPAAMKTAIAIFAVVLPVVFFTPIKNLIVYKNPVWPVQLASFPYLDKAYSQSPPHLEGAPRFVRFVRSVLEVDNRPISSYGRWTLDQWAPWDDPSCRMGGYFGAYVALNLAALVALVAITHRRRTKETRRAATVAAALFGSVTVVAANVPQSHELRYYMHWMLLLVSLNLVLFTADPPDANDEVSERPRRERWFAASLAIGAFIVVSWSLKGGFLYASGSSFAEFLTKNTEQRVIDEVSPGERICIQREPFTFLYAPAFHPKKPYAVQEARDPSDCDGARRIP